MTREIICADALEWMPSNNSIGSVVTSPPDAAEIGATVDDWEPWFAAALDKVFALSTGRVVLYVTDRKHSSRIASKAALVLAAGSRAGQRPSWHKIALRRGVGKVDIHRPGFSHLIAFGGACGVSTPDVIDRGRTLYPNGTGLAAALIACAWAGKVGGPIVDPFCGRGTIPAAANSLGLDSIGVDIDLDQCRFASQIELDHQPVKRGGNQSVGVAPQLPVE